MKEPRTVRGGETMTALSRTRAALLVVDIQERLVAGMPEEILAKVLRDSGILIAAARKLGLPIVVSQQYPKGLGPTLPVVEEALAGYADVHRFDKLEFSAADATRIEIKRDQWIVCGMETHVCVYQTARGLIARGETVHVATDATCSRTKANWQIGCGLIERSGAILTSTEACVFDLLERAGSDEFKALSKLIK